MKINEISVIIPFYNEEKYITKCLQSVSHQTKKPDEIIVVDDGSTDNSLRIIRKFEIRNSKFEILRQQHMGPAVARNFGASKARGNILVFLDADMKYEKNYIEKLVEPIIQKREIATFSRSEYIANPENKWAKLWNEVTYSDPEKRSASGSKNRALAFRAILKREFFKAHGFDNIGYSDDSTLMKKLKKTAKSVDTAKCYHFNPSSLSEVFYSARWMGRSIKNRGKWIQFFIFSPFWSFVKAVVGTIQKKNISFFPFRLTFDFGYFTGLINISVGDRHFK